MINFHGWMNKKVNGTHHSIRYALDAVYSQFPSTRKYSLNQYFYEMEKNRNEVYSSNISAISPRHVFMKHECPINVKQWQKSRSPTF